MAPQYQDEGWNQDIIQIAQPKFKRKVTVEFKIPNRQVECNVHGWMNAIVVVEDNPSDALTDANGSFKITDVPRKIYCEGLAFQTWRVTKEVTVGPKEEVKLPRDEGTLKA